MIVSLRGQLARFFYQDSRAKFLRAVSVTGVKVAVVRAGVVMPVTEPFPENVGSPREWDLMRAVFGARPLRGPSPPASVAGGPRHFPPDFIRLEICRCAAKQ
jgi:hypothetical protein